jgi:threonyl-tRNA synthetase
LPIRWAELGTVYRHERSGTMHGLMRVRGFTQDDAHIFCLPSQLENEIVGVLNLTEKILKKFGFASFEVVLSTRPDKSVGSDEVWEIATRSLSNALHKKNLSFTTDNGGGAFYGPKIDIKICDAIGRKWQCSTIQCDFNLPERFELEYVDSDQSRQRPIMVHRAIFGSLERFFGILIENTAGEFPLWLAPVHLRLLPVSENVIEYCNEVKRLGTSMGIRIEIDSDGNRLAKQIRNAEMEHIPLMAIVGDQEKAEGLLSLRSRKKGDEGTIPMNTALSAILRSIENCDEFSL